MTEDQRDLLNKAKESLAAAKWLLEGQFPDHAASRAYYAMFHTAQAFLEGEGLAFSKHSAVISAFGKHFTHAGRVPIAFHRFLIEAQELRETGDYGPIHSITSEQAEEQIRRAEQFLQLAQNLVDPVSPTS
ncbi:MAG: HEPN domain-containing protein [bacterium]